MPRTVVVPTGVVPCGRSACRMKLVPNPRPRELFLPTLTETNSKLHSRRYSVRKLRHEADIKLCGATLTSYSHHLCLLVFDHNTSKCSLLLSTLSSRTTGQRARRTLSAYPTGQLSHFVNKMRINEFECKYPRFQTCHIGCSLTLTQASLRHAFYWSRTAVIMCPPTISGCRTMSCVD
jgi:hypothetical protein